MLPIKKRFDLRDYPGAERWLADMFVPLNHFVESTYNLVDKNLVVGENVQGMKYTLTFTTPTDYATGGFQQIVFRYTGGGRPTCCLLGQIANSDRTTILTTPSVSSWYLDLNKSPYQIVINYIAGLSADTTYTIQLLVL